MPHHLHLVQRVVERHRLRAVQLLPDHHRRVAPHRLHRGFRVDRGRRLRLRQRRTNVDRGQRLRRLVEVLVPVPRPPQSLHQLGHGDVQRCVRVVGARLRTDHGPLAPDGDLHPLGHPGLPGVPLVGQLDVDDPGSRGELADLGELVLDMAAEALGHLDVTAGDDDLHGYLLGRGGGAARRTPGHTPHGADGGHHPLDLGPLPKPRAVTRSLRRSLRSPPALRGYGSMT